MGDTIRHESDEVDQIATPVGARMLWTLATLLCVGIVVCVAGLILTDSDREAAVGAYIAGLVVAAGVASLLAGLASRRRRVVFEAELAVAALNRIQARADREDLDRQTLRLRLAQGLEKARAFRGALISAEAYAQAADLDRTVTDAEDLLDDVRKKTR
jgi:hypothetical protein